VITLILCVSMIHVYSSRCTFVRMCRDILNTCIRNTEEAERSVRAAQQDSSNTPPSGRGQGKGVWNMIEESELAKSIRLDEGKKVRAIANSLAFQAY
jgi:hypothetical protein